MSGLLVVSGFTDTYLLMPIVFAVTALLCRSCPRQLTTRGAEIQEYLVAVLAEYTLSGSNDECIKPISC